MNGPAREWPEYPVGNSNETGDNVMLPCIQCTELTHLADLREGGICVGCAEMKSCRKCGELFPPDELSDFGCCPPCEGRPVDESAALNAEIAAELARVDEILAAG